MPERRVIMKVSKIHKITKAVVDVIFVLGIIAVILVPLFVNWWSKLMKYSAEMTILLDIVLILSGIVAVYVLWQVHIILRNVVQNKVFTDSTVTCLRKISIGTLLVSIIYFIKLFFNFGMGTLVISGSFLIATLIFLTLKDVFKQANAIKKENDWTI